MRPGHATPVPRIRRQAEGRHERKGGSASDNTFLSRVRAGTARLRVSF